MDRESKVLYSNRSLAQLKLGRFDEAVEDAEMAISLDAGWPKGYIRKANALLAKGDPGAAAECYEACLRQKTIRSDAKQRKAVGE